MTIKDDIEIGDSKPEVSEPLLVKTLAEQDGSGIGNSTRKSSEGQPWMVYLSTFVAVCGSFEFGACAGYSSPTQSAITEELDLSTAEVLKIYFL